MVWNLFGSKPTGTQLLSTPSRATPWNILDEVTQENLEALGFNENNWNSTEMGDSNTEWKKLTRNRRVLPKFWNDPENWGAAAVIAPVERPKEKPQGPDPGLRATGFLPPSKTKV